MKKKLKTRIYKSNIKSKVLTIIEAEMYFPPTMKDNTSTVIKTLNYHNNILGIKN